MNNPKKQREKVKDQFTKQAAAYAKVVEASKTKAGAGFDRIQFIEASSDDNVLDVACGTGAFALTLAKYVNSVMGIDCTPAMINQARSLQREKDAKNISWHIGDVHDLPFDRDSFSLVVCSAAFHHLDDPLGTLLEMARVCQVGGKIVVNDVTPFPEKSSEFDWIEHLKDPSHTHALTLPELKSVGQAARLEEWKTSSYEATFPLDFILNTVFPEKVTIDEIRALYRQDAESGDDRFGIKATLKGEEIWVSYPMSAVVWLKN